MLSIESIGPTTYILVGFIVHAPEGGCFLETDRLNLRWLSPDDGEFMLELLNDPSWLEFIGDRGVRTVEGAREYILNGPVEMYNRLGFGLFLTERKADGVPVGICGLIKRDSLEDVDIGYAFLPQFWGNGYAYESASATLTHGRTVLGFDRIVRSLLQIIKNLQGFLKNWD